MYLMQFGKNHQVVPIKKKIFFQISSGHVSQSGCSHKMHSEKKNNKVFQGHCLRPACNTLVDNSLLQGSGENDGEESQQNKTRTSKRNRCRGKGGNKNKAGPPSTLPVKPLAEQNPPQQAVKT